MNQTRISLEQTGRFNRLILDYINGEKKLAGFYSLAHTKENYAKQIESRSKIPLDRNLLADSLRRQYEPIGGAKELVKTNIEKLRLETTFTVTTGHQLNIFTGPLYFVYKILHTIKLSEELNAAYTKHHFVPIYWMNSEDHDLEEVGQFNLFGEKYIWSTDQTGATGKMNPEGLIEFCSELEKVFSDDAETLKLVSVFRKAYAEYGDLATATRFFSDYLFGKFGLVIIDSNDALLKKPLVPYMKRDVFDNESFNLIHNTNRELVENSYHCQVNPRQINLFYLADGIRNRIVETEKGFHVLHTDIRFSKEELSAELELKPERFSPNVVLRPLFQELILPNLTYVGGAGELSYWLQYKAYFQEMDVSFPLLALRNHLLLIPESISTRMDELKLFPEDLFHPVNELVRELVVEISDADVSLDTERLRLKEFYSGLKSKAADVDLSLVASVEAEETRMKKSLEQWEGRFTRSLKKEYEVSVNRIKKLHKKLFPNEYLQERHDNILAFYSAKEDFIGSIQSVTEPFGTDFKVVNL